VRAVHLPVDVAGINEHDGLGVVRSAGFIPLHRGRE
jgi:hypothetical protein